MHKFILSAFYSPCAFFSPSFVAERRFTAAPNRYCKLPKNSVFDDKNGIWSCFIQNAYSAVHFAAAIGWCRIIKLPHNFGLFFSLPLHLYSLSNGWKNKHLYALVMYRFSHKWMQTFMQNTFNRQSERKKKSQQQQQHMLR